MTPRRSSIIGLSRGNNLNVPEVPRIETERLILRDWKQSDRAGFALMNADPLVMEHFPTLLTTEQSDEFIDRTIAHWSRGYGHWAVEERSSATFVGFVGLYSPGWEAHFTPAVEIGWRLAREAWNKGYATEAATRVLEWAKENVELPNGEIVSFTTVGNARSRRVMEKLGLHRDVADDFEHPSLPDWDQRLHVLYRMTLQPDGRS
jgi:ribosomal-protein-alanine N-acetyltransferase